MYLLPRDLQKRSRAIFRCSEQPPQTLKSGRPYPQGRLRALEAPPGAPGTLLGPLGPPGDPSSAPMNFILVLCCSKCTILDLNMFQKLLKCVELL